MKYREKEVREARGPLFAAEEALKRKKQGGRGIAAANVRKISICNYTEIFSYKNPNKNERKKWNVRGKRTEAQGNARNITKM